MQQIDNQLVIVDLREEFICFSKMRTGYKIYNNISLKELIENILTVPAIDVDFNEYIWDVISNRLDLDNTEENYDLQVIDIFIDTITQILDEKLRNIFPKHINYSRYVIDSWLGNTTVVLREYEYFRQSDIYSSENKQSIAM